MKGKGDMKTYELDLDALTKKAPKKRSSLNKPFTGKAVASRFNYKNSAISKRTTVKTRRKKSHKK